MSTLRGYLSAKQYKSMTGDDLGSDADKIINRAEAIIDSMLGYHTPFIGHIQGVIAGVAPDNSIALAPEHIVFNTKNHYAGCVIEMITGAAQGEFVTISSSDENGIITLGDNFEDAPAAGDVYHVYQMGKFPRFQDVTTTPLDGRLRVVARHIPQVLREAVAAQVQYMQSLGDDYFNGQSFNMDSENFGSYSYTKSNSAKGSKALTAPKARDALSGSGLINRVGRFVGY